MPAQHPPILVSADGHHFVDREGRPVFVMGDTQWELFRLFTPDQARHILHDRQARGFNVILVMLLGVDMTFLKVDAKPPQMNLHGELPWLDNDPLRPNEKYFAHIDEMIGLGSETGQTFLVGVYHMWHKGIITLDNARPWARWVARRYRDVPNLIWSMYPRALPEFVAISREIAAGLNEGDGGAHLISVHPDPSPASSSFLHDEPWLAFNQVQTSVYYDRLYDMVRADYLRCPAKPVVMAEGGYEGLQDKHLQTAHEIRKQAYWTQLAGGHHVYGHMASWMTPTEYEQWLDSPGVRSLSVFRQILTSLEQWWTLTPEPAILASGAGEGLARNVAARSASGRWAIVYLADPSTVTVRLDLLAPERPVCATWIDPVTGKRAGAGNVAATGTQTFTPPPGWQDALLLFTA